MSPRAKTITPKQGQYLAFFPSVPDSVAALANQHGGTFSRQPAVGSLDGADAGRSWPCQSQPRALRSIEVLVDPKSLPELICTSQPVKNHCAVSLGNHQKRECAALDWPIGRHAERLFMERLNTT